MKKKMLSVFLLLCMILTMLPVTALAANNAHSTMSTDIGEKTFIAGSNGWVEFSFSTTANGDAGKMVYGTSDFATQYEDKIAALEYKQGDQWLDMKGQDFGNPDVGFPMSDATSTFRVKFTEDAAGTYNFTASMMPVEGGEALCSIDVPFTVQPFTHATMSTDIREKNFVVGKPTEFTFTTVANGDADKMVIGTSNFSDAEAIEKLEYFETQDNAWHEFSGDFGPSTGFPMSDATSKFRVTFKKAGNYTFTASMKTVDDDETLCSTEVTFNVRNASSSGGGGSSSSSSYTITVDKAAGGTVKVSPTRASKGNTVTITVDPKEGYELDKLVVTDKNGDAVKLTDKGDGKYTFQMPASKVTVEATFTEVGTEPETPVFTDVSSSAYYYDAVLWAVENGVTEGTSSTTFSPDMNCTRAQMVTFLWRANGSPKATSANPFTDVQAGSYYYDAVLWAVEKGITSGTSSTTFSPDMTVTRGQTVTFLHRANGSPAASGNSPFTDVAADTYYAAAVQWAVAEGVTSGTSATTFAPDAACTRGQIVTFLYRDMA